MAHVTEQQRSAQDLFGEGARHTGAVAGCRHASARLAIAAKTDWSCTPPWMGIL